MGLLESIDGPAQVRALDEGQLPALADELRRFILDSVSRTGGHLGTNLGVVELTVALLHVFDPPTDKIVWDTTHQTYAYKILTGRRERFHTLRQKDGLSGFQSRRESPFDAFGAGHAGTALSAALGMAVARDQRGGAEHVVAVVGDAALGCGISFEAMNNISTTTRRLIVILNDNEMSIAENVGAISKYLGRLLTSRKYNRVKTNIENVARKALRSPWYREAYHRAEEAVKGIFLRSPMFEELGLRYIGPVDGHDLAMLVSALKSARDDDKPILLHVATTKGKGYKPAEDAPEVWHSTTGFAFDPTNCAPVPPAATAPSTNGGPPRYQDVFGRVAIELARKDERIVAITAGMPSGTGLSPFAGAFPTRFFDVGISEEHAVIFAAGLACENVRPLVAIYSTFLQRAVDCVIHDVCLQQLPVVFCLDRAGVVGDDGPTHHGVFDIALFRAVPDLTMMQPCDEAEFTAMLHLAVHLGRPVMIRYPRGKGTGVAVPTEPMEIPFGRAQVVEEGADVQIWALGDMLPLGRAVARRLRAAGFSAGVVNPRFIQPMDHELAAEQARAARLFVTIENGVREGGFGSGLQEALSDAGEATRVLRCGWPRAFVTHAGPADLLRLHGLTEEAIAEAALALLARQVEPVGGLQG